MTALTASTAARTTEDRARTVLRLDAAVTGAVGLLALADAPALAGDVPTWLVRTVGAVLLVTAADIALASRWSGRRLRLTALVTGELAVAWVLATVVVLALGVLSTTGAVVAALVGVVTAGFAVAQLRSARSLSSEGADTV